MQIQSDYNSYSGTGYEQKHDHHITKCLHEEQQEYNKAAAAGIRKDAFSAEKSRKDLKKEITFTHEEARKQSVGTKKGKGFVKGLWDSLGEEGENDRQGIFSSGGSHMGTRGIDAVSSAIKQIFPYRIINKWENVREKIRVSVSTALKRFGKDGAAFGALTDPKGHFTGKREADKQLEEDKEKDTRQKEGAIPTAFLSDSHLMDSYSKTGAYCRLNENLTYQKKSVSVKPENRPLKGE